MDIADTEGLAAVLKESGAEAVVHFAAFIAVGESMLEPARYFSNNVCGSLSLLAAIVEAGVKHVVFSSTAAVYGNPHATPNCGDVSHSARERLRRIEGDGGNPAAVVRRDSWHHQRKVALLQRLRPDSAGPRQRLHGGR